jgi:Domain of unknown function (DUF2431)
VLRLSNGGRIEVTLRNTPFYVGWDVHGAAAKAGLRCVEIRTFDPHEYYPGYTFETTASDVQPPDISNSVLLVFKKKPVS